MRITLIILLGLFLPVVNFAADKPIVIGQALESMLDQASLKRDGVSYETWVFAGKAGNVVTIEMTSQMFDSVLKLLDSNGNLMAIDDNGGFGYNSRIVIKIPKDGRFFIEATTVWQVRGGSYKLSIINGETPIKTGEEKLKEDISYYEQCLVETKDPSWASELHTGRLRVLSEVRADNQAVEAAELAVVLAEKSGDKFALARAYLAITNRMLRDEEYSGAIKYFEQILQIQRDLKNREGEATTLSALADAHLSTDRYSEARAYHQQALEIYKELKDKRSEGASLFGLAQSYRLERNPGQAITHYEQALVVAKETNDLSGAGYALFGLADCYRSLEKTDQMFSFYEMALKSGQDAKNYKLQGVILAAVADIYRSQSDFEKALPYYEKNLVARTEAKDLRGQAYTLNAIAVCERNLKKFDSSLKHYQQMQAICKENKDRRGESIALLGLGLIYKMLLQSQQSINAYEQALIVVRETKDRRGEYSALTGLGTAYTNLNQPTRALPYLEQAAIINQEIPDNKNTMVLLEALANTYFAAGQPESASNYCEKLLVFKREAKDRLGEANALLLQTAIAAKQGELNKVANAFEQARNIFLELKNFVGAYSCNYGLAKLAIQRGDSKTAQTQYENAIGIIENNIQLEITDTLGFVTPLQVYEGYVELLASQKQFAVALVVAEKMKVSQFNETLKKSLLGKEDKITTEFFKPFSVVNFNEIVNTSQRLNLTILSYLPMENGLLIWVVKPDGTLVGYFNKIDSKRLDSLLDEYHSLLPYKNIRSDKLFEALGANVAPIKNTYNLTMLEEEVRSFLLPEIIVNALPTEIESKLLFVASGKLGTISFSNLKDNFGNYLIDKFVVLQSPSLSTFTITNNIRNKTEPVVRNEVLALGIAASNSFNGNALPVLADSKTEIKAAQNFKAKVLTGVMATKGNLCEQAKGKHLVHLVAYSYLNDKEPLKSFLSLNPQTNDQGNIINDGVITLNDLQKCLENNNLIILTVNQNSNSNGNGLFFLTNTLALNNNSGILLTLWEVDAKVTTSFAEAFYEQLKKTSDVAISYRRAVLKVKEKYKTPSQWATFVFVGEPVN